MLRGHYGGHYGGHCAGHCAEIARPLLVFRPYFLIRGWCLTKMTGFPIPESRQRFRSTEHLKLIRPWANYQALTGRSETGSETEQVGSGMNGRRRS